MSPAARDPYAADCRLLDEQVAALVDWLRALDADDSARSHEVAAQCVRIIAGMLAWLDRPSAARPLSGLAYVASSTPDLAGGDRPLQDPVQQLAAARDDARAALPQHVPGAVIDAPRGPIAVGDWVATRLADLVVHADDLTRLMPDRAPVPIAAQALRRVARLLAEMISERAPGRAVELRVPPAVAVQIVEGLTHTRGTPPNVVETDPLTWLRLATGRVAFADAVANGAVRASGSRADLTELLPLFS